MSAHHSLPTLCLSSWLEITELATRMREWAHPKAVQTTALAYTLAQIMVLSVAECSSQAMGTCPLGQVRTRAVGEELFYCFDRFYALVYSTDKLTGMDGDLTDCGEIRLLFQPIAWYPLRLASHLL